MKFSLDQTTDYSHRELYSLLHDTALPSFVKEAEVDDAQSVASLSKEAFADQYNKAFPIHTPSATYLSNVYFLNKKAALTKEWGENYTETVHTRIKQAAALHEILDSMFEYEKIATAKNEEDYQTQHIFTAKFAGMEYPLFPFKTAEELVKNANGFVSQVSCLPFEWRREIAQNFIKKAIELEVDELPDLIGKYAGYFYPNKAEVEIELWRRESKLKTAEAKELYAEAKDKLAKASNNEDYFKLAQALEHAEIQDGATFNQKIASVLGDPVDRIFTLTIEKVAGMLDFISMGGEKFDIQALQKISSEVYKEAFGVELDPKKAEDLRDILPTMPLSDVSLFKELSGVQPL